MKGISTLLSMLIGIILVVVILLVLLPLTIDFAEGATKNSGNLFFGLIDTLLSIFGFGTPT